MAGKKGQKSKLHNEESKKCKEYYYKNFPKYSEEQIKEAIKRYKKEINWRCVEYWQVKYPDLSLEELEKIRKEKIKEQKTNSPQYVEYYIKRNPSLTLEDAKKLCHNHNIEHNFQNIEYYKKKYPNASIEECKKILKEVKKSYLAKRPDNHGINNPAHHSRVSEYERRRRSPRCIEFYQYKYPNESLEFCEAKRQEHMQYIGKRIKETIKDTNIEYYLNKGMSIEEAKLALKERQTTFSLDKCIKKYGKEEGIKKFQERQEKWIHSLKRTFIDISKDNHTNYFQSKLQNNIYQDLLKYINKNDIYTEYYIFDNKLNKGFSFDIKYKNKIIEVQGDFWHCNPKFFEENFYNKAIKLTAKEIWERDNIKNNVATSNGFEVYYIWEDDYNNHPELEIQKCINFLCA